MVAVRHCDFYASARGERPAVSRRRASEARITHSAKPTRGATLQQLAERLASDLPSPPQRGGVGGGGPKPTACSISLRVALMQGSRENRENVECLAMGQHRQARCAGDVSHLETDGGMACEVHQKLRLAHPAGVFSHEVLGLQV